MRGIRGATPRPFLGRGIQVDLHVRIREHDGADIPAFHHDAPRLGKGALTRDENRA